MLERHYSAERINQILNHPSILPHIRGNHKSIDWSAIAANPDHISLVGKYGCVLFIKHQPGVYEFHTSVLPEGRGKWMLDGAMYAFHYMFTKTDAYELITKCPDGNLASKAGARAVGCTKVFRTGKIWPSNNEMVCVDVYSILIQHWVNNAPGLVERGQWFHDNLLRQYSEMGIKESLHEDDETHDRYVGATVEILQGTQILKAVNFYNRWASLAGYKRISVVSLNPLVINIDEAHICVEDNDFKVLPCPQVELIS